MATSPLPEFDSPPVVEVALSVQFERLPSSVQVALAWEQFRNSFPVIQEQPELEPVIERFGVVAQPSVRVRVSPISTPRLWFVDKEENQLVQLQRDRFIRNWRKTDAQPDYPRYPKIKSAFDDDWKSFEEFVVKTGNQLQPNQCEVTYVNIVDGIEQRDLHKVLNFVDSPKSSILGEPEDLSLNMRYQLKNDKDEPIGRLYVSVTPSLRLPDHKAVLRLALTARGAPKERNLRGVQQFFDLAHDVIVHTFTDLTSEDMHKVWGRRK